VSDEQKRVFVYGDFDIIHVNHIKMLRFAAELGEVTVALRTDEAMESQRKQRWFSFEERLEVVSQLKMISFIRQLDEHSPIPMLIDMYRVADGPHYVISPFHRLGRFTQSAELEIAVGAYGGMAVPFDVTHDRAVYWALRAIKNRDRTMKKLRRKV
jgi:cytidyltransferase-like protein